MKTLILMFCLLFGISGFSQKKENAGNASENQNKQPYFKLSEPASYKLHDRQFTFTPEKGRIHIRTAQNFEDIDYGDLRRTTDDGLYIMTSTVDDNVSFGRFDSLGNFRSLRYDRVKDSVIEERYIKEALKKPDAD